MVIHRFFLLFKTNKMKTLKKEEMKLVKGGQIDPEICTQIFHLCWRGLTKLGDCMPNYWNCLMSQ